MRRRVRVAAVTAGVLALGVFAGGTSYWLSTVSRADRWTEIVGFSPMDPGAYAHDDCVTLAIHSLAYQRAEQHKPNVRNLSATLEKAVEVAILNAAKGAGYCRSYSAFAREQRQHINETLHALAVDNPS